MNDTRATMSRRARVSPDPNILTTQQAAEFLNVTSRTIHNMVGRGDLHPLVPKGTYVKPPILFFRREELEKVRAQLWEPELVPYLPPKRRAIVAAQQAQRPAGSVA